MTRRAWWIALAAVMALAVAASANSLPNGFAYDDTYILEKAGRHSMEGWWRDFASTYWPRAMGGDGYRPLTVVAFRAQWLLGGGSPAPFHAVNVALHVIAAGLVFWMATAVLPLAAAFVAAALYAVHPVHVEAIANVVGQSELVVAVLFVAALGLYLHGRLAGPLSAARWCSIGALYVVACFFKEHAIVLPAVLVVAELTVVPDRAPLRRRLRSVQTPLMALGAAGLAFYWVRSLVVLGGGAGFVPFLPFQVVQFTAADRVFTAIGVAPEWLRLLLWPARLSAQYSPQNVEIAQGLGLGQLPGLFVLLGILGIAAVCWRRSPVTSFGIVFLILTLLPSSNFLLPAGFIIAERTLLLPSVGAMLAVASVVPWLYDRIEERRGPQLLAGGAFAVLLALGVWRSVERNRVWRDNDTLFRQSVVDAPDSYRAHHMLGQLLFQRGERAAGEMHLRRAIELFPHDPFVMYSLAEEYRKVGWCPPAIPLYQSAFAISPAMRKSQHGLAVCYLEVLDMDEARTTALSAIRWGGDVPSARRIIAAANVGRDSLAARRARGDTTARSTP